MAILTIEELKTKYGFSFSSNKDEQMRSALAAAESVCLKYLGFENEITTSFVQYFDGGYSRFVLKFAPVVRVLNIYIDTERRFLEPISDDFYRLDEKTGVVTLYCRPAPSGRDVMKVEYEAGYSTVPEDIKMCIALTCQQISRLVQSSLVGITSRTTDGGTESIDQNFPTLAVQKTLERYRLGRIL